MSGLSQETCLVVSTQEQTYHIDPPRPIVHTRGAPQGPSFADPAQTFWVQRSGAQASDLETSKSPSNEKSRSSPLHPTRFMAQKPNTACMARGADFSVAHELAVLIVGGLIALLVDPRDGSSLIGEFSGHLMGRLRSDRQSPSPQAHDLTGRDAQIQLMQLSIPATRLARRRTSWVFVLSFLHRL